MKIPHGMACAAASLALCFLAGCGRDSTSEKSVDEPTAQNRVTAVEPTPAKPAENNAPLQQKIRFNLDKLKDRNYTKTYGEGYIWYTAAEELGEIGKPVVPHLVRKLDTKDPYELKLALYALQLASQDSRVTSLTNGEYVNLVSALDEKDNAKNKEIALHWWNKYKSRLQPVV